MKSALVTVFVLFFIMSSSPVFAQTYEIDAVIPGSKLSEYNNSNRDYYEGLIDAIRKFTTITIREGDLAIVSMTKSDWKLLFRFYKNVNTQRMSHEDYLNGNEFYCTSDIINGINYLEMSVKRVSGKISSGEIKCYPEKGLYKPIFIVKFHDQNTNLSPNKSHILNTDSKQKLVFVNIEHVTNVDYESVNDLRNYLFESEIKISESDEEILLEMKNTEKGNVEWKFFRVFEGDHKTDAFLSMPDKSGNVRKLVLKKDSDKIGSVEIGCYQKDKEGAIYVVYLSAPKTQTANNENIIQTNESSSKASFNKQVKRLNYSTKEVDVPNSKEVKIKSKFEVVKFTIVDTYYSYMEPLYFKTILFENEDNTTLYYEEYDNKGNEIPSGTAGRERYHFNGENYFQYEGDSFNFLTFEKDKSGKIVSAKIEIASDSLKTHCATIFLKKL